jgi:hypothetical protein
MVLEVEPATKDLKAVSSLNHPDNCSVKISLYRTRKNWLISVPVSHSGIK